MHNDIKTYKQNHARQKGRHHGKK